MAQDVSEMPLVIEAAMTQVIANTDGKLPTTAGIVREALDCVEAGAGMVHYHHDFSLNKEDSITQCIEVQRAILKEHPDALVYPGYLSGKTHEETMEHLEPIYEAGVMSMFAFDPGHATHARPDENGEPTRSHLGGTSFDQATRMVEDSWRYNAPVSLGIFEPGPLKWVRYFGANWRFTPGTVVKFYFPGDASWGVKGVGATFGIPPSKAALDIYLSMIEGSGLPWMVSILGGAILETELPRYILEKGGNIRVGIEDPLRPMDMSNVEMVRAVVELASEVGRPVAAASQARSVLADGRQAVTEDA